jgi:hypothetical protein
MLRNVARVAFQILMIHAAMGCDDSNRNKGEPPGSKPPDAQPVPVSCPAKIEDLINVRDGEDTVPTWEQLDCFTNTLVRKPTPKFLSDRLTDFSKYIEDRTTPNLGWTMYQDIDAQTTALGTDVAMWNTLNQVPPYVELSTNTVYTFPLKPEWHERKIRFAASIFIAQKKKDRFTSAVFFYPPTPLMSWAFASSQTVFKEWYLNHFIPEKVVEAKALERIKVERYTPFVVELETWVARILPFAAVTSTAEKVELAQWMIDTLVPELRKHFKGLIHAHSYINYELNGVEWNRLNFSKFDTLGFSYFPVCGGQDHNTYLQIQFENYLKVVENSGNIPWGVSEIGPSKKTWVDNGCMSEAEYSDIEPVIFEVFINKMKTVTPAPSSTGFASTFVNPATSALVAEYLSSR